MFILEDCDMYEDEVLDTWFKGLYSSKDSLNGLFKRFKELSVHTFRVLEVVPDNNEIINAWMIRAGDQQILWLETDDRPAIY